MFKKIFQLFICSLSLSALAVGCSKKNPEAVLRIGCTPVPHEEILRFVEPHLLKKGIHLKVVVFNDYVQPNTQLVEGNLDANYYQTIPYLKNFVESTHSDLSALVKVHFEPFGLYSSRHEKIDQESIPKKAVVAIPNEVSNRARALHLLEKLQLVTLSSKTDLFASLKTNPLDLKIVEMDAAMLARSLSSADIVGINANFALAAGMNPMKDAKVLEEKDAPYANVVVVKTSDLHRPAIQILRDTFLSDELRDFIQSHYQGSVLPSF